MRTLTAAAAALVAAVVFAVGPAGAVQYGQPDDGRHPYVGLLVAFDASGARLWRCTGSLVAPSALLTAAHCVDRPATSVRVWFDEQVTAAVGYPFGGGVTGVPVPHPSFPGPVPATHDVGVVVLDAPVTHLGVAPLAPAGYLDALERARGLQDVTFEVVGYGFQGIRPRLEAERERRVGVVSLVGLRSALTDGYNVQLTNDPGLGHGGSGGTCRGDSGGPVLHDGLVVAVDSFGLNRNCKGTSFAYRVDTADSLDFLADFLAR